MKPVTSSASVAGGSSTSARIAWMMSSAVRSPSMSSQILQPISLSP
jgi:hypothetical protein